MRKEKEIDILIKAATKSCAVVEKTSNVLWTTEELLDAEAAGQFQAQDSINPPDGRVEVSGPFPGCMQQSASMTDYRPVGHTEHFVIFATPASGSSCSNELSL